MNHPVRAEQCHVETVLAHGPRTRDIGGSASTRETGRAIAEAV